MGTSTGSSLTTYTESNAPTIVIGISEEIPAQLTVPDVAANHGAFITSPTIASDLNNGTWDNTALFWSTTETVDGTTSSSTSVVVDDLSNLVIGMKLIASTAGGDSIGTNAEITAINTGTKTLTLSAASSLTNNATMTFRAYGPSLIKKAIDISLKVKNPTVRLGQESTTIRSQVTSGYPVVVDVKGTGGISKGAKVRGKFVDNSSSTSVCSISAVNGSTIAGAAGTVTITNGRYDATTNNIEINTVLYVDGSSADIYLGGTLSINKYPVANQTIYIDLSKFLTIGTAS